jgi:hypothetical protein
MHLEMLDRHKHDGKEGKHLAYWDDAIERDQCSDREHLEIYAFNACMDRISPGEGDRFWPVFNGRKQHLNDCFANFLDSAHIADYIRVKGLGWFMRFQKLYGHLKFEFYEFTTWGRHPVKPSQIQYPASIGGLKRRLNFGELYCQNRIIGCSCSSRFLRPKLEFQEGTNICLICRIEIDQWRRTTLFP